MKQIEGILPALITPFTTQGTVYEESLRKLVKMNIDKGVDGFYVCGSTAEAFLLTLEERKKILEIVMDETNGRGVIICHVGCISTTQAIELAQHAKAIGADAISSIPPFYYKFTMDEIKGYYLDILDRVDMPMLLYNFPAMSGISLNSENTKELFKNPRIIGIKFTSFDLYELERIKKDNEGLVILIGHDEIYLAALAMGVDGAVGSTYNFIAEMFIQIRNLFNEGNYKEAREVQSSVNEIISILLKVGVYQGIKYILTSQGIDCGKCRRPFNPLTSSDKKKLKKVLAKA